jgi:hypothetical protein
LGWSPARLGLPSEQIAIAELLGAGRLFRCAFARYPAFLNALGKPRRRISESCCATTTFRWFKERRHAENSLVLEQWKAALWKPRSMPDGLVGRRSEPI